MKITLSTSLKAADTAYDAATVLGTYDSLTAGGRTQEQDNAESELNSLQAFHFVPERKCFLQMVTSEIGKHRRTKSNAVHRGRTAIHKTWCVQATGQGTPKK